MTKKLNTRKPDFTTGFHDKITDLSEEVFNFLIQNRNSTEQEQSHLNSTLRIENKGKKLDNGFWSYGNDDNVIISFWTGNDWRYETQTFIFQNYE